MHALHLSGPRAVSLGVCLLLAGFVGCDDRAEPGGSGGAGGDAGGGAGGSAGGQGGTGGQVEPGDACGGDDDPGSGVVDLVVAGTFGGTLSLAGTDQSLVAVSDSDSFVFTIAPETGTERLQHLVTGRTRALVVDHLYRYEAPPPNYKRIVCGEHEGDIEVWPGEAQAWKASSRGGSDIFCSWDERLLISGPGEERLGGISRVTRYDPNNLPSDGFSLHGAISEGAEVVSGDIRTPMPESRGGLDGFVAKFSSDAAHYGVDVVGGRGDDFVRAVHEHPHFKSSRDYVYVGTFGGGQAAGSATFGVPPGINVTSHGGADVFVASMSSQGAAGGVVVAGGPGDDTVDAYAGYFKPGGPGLTTRALLAGPFGAPPFQVAGLDALDSVCKKPGYALEVGFRNAYGPYDAKVPTPRDLNATCGVSVASMVLPEDGAVAAFHHGPGATIDLGSGPISLPDPPNGGRAGALGWFPSSGTGGWMSRFSSDSSLEILGLCEASAASNLAHRWVVVGAFEGKAVFGDGTAKEVTLEAVEGAGTDGFVALVNDHGCVVQVMRLGGEGDQRAESCLGR
jgi:hypothetical protein